MSKPGIALRDVRLTEEPCIVRRGNEYYLRYRAAPEEAGEISARVVVAAKIANDKGYYYFVGRISLPERDSVVERALRGDGLTEFARRRSVYWLNPDGSEVPLEFKQE